MFFLNIWVTLASTIEARSHQMALGASTIAAYGDFSHLGLLFISLSLPE